MEEQIRLLFEKLKLGKEIRRKTTTWKKKSIEKSGRNEKTRTRREEEQRYTLEEKEKQKQEEKAEKERR